MSANDSCWEVWKTRQRIVTQEAMALGDAWGWTAGSSLGLQKKPQEMARKSRGDSRSALG